MAASISCSSTSSALVSKLNDGSFRKFNPLLKKSGWKNSWRKFSSLHICAKLNSPDSQRETISERVSFNPKVGFENAISRMPASLFALSVPSVILFTPFTSLAETLASDACPEIGGADVNTIIAIACIAEGIALTGAFVGGILARQRKQEVERINAQLRQINFNLRRQARLESYAPSLSYAPVVPPVSSDQILVPTSPPKPSSPKPAVSESLPQVETKVDPSNGIAVEIPGKGAILRRLKLGKKYLRERNPLAAFKEFKLALSMAKEIGDSVELKKAARGCGASCQRQGKHLDAVKYHLMVLEASEASQETSGNTEAYGAIADCYTEIGDLENAAKYYDLYINGLEKD